MQEITDNMLDRFSFQSIYGLFETAKDLSERSIRLDSNVADHFDKLEVLKRNI